jgi:hypothetical protein
LSTVNQALASELGLELFLNAFALTKEVTPIVNGAEYDIEDSVGVVPLVV